MPTTMRKAVAFSLCLLFALFAHVGLVAAQTTTASYAGTYSGTFSGGDSGSFTAVIASSGGLTLSGSSSVEGLITGSGQVSSTGSLQMTTGSTTEGSTFTGTIDPTSGALSGTWSNSAFGVNGSFAGTRTSAPVTTTTTSTTSTTTTVATTTTTTQAAGGAGVPLNLKPGWNLMANSSATPIEVAATFGDASKITSVWKWKQSASTWAFYAPSMTASALTVYAQGKGYDVLTSLAPKEGFWVNASSDVALAGPAASAVTLAESDLQSGWNLVGSADNKTPSQLNQGLSSGLNASGKAMVTAWAWDAPSAAWRFYAPSLEAQGGTALADYIGSKGYLPFDSSLSASDGFWVNVGAASPAPSTPASVPPFTSMSGYHTVFGLAANGDLWGWGWNGHGELGIGTKADTIKAQLLGSGYASISPGNGGESYTLAVKADGTLLSWGSDLFGTGAADVLTPQVVGSGGFVAVAASTYYQVALKSDGSLWTWGRNSSGLAGDGTISAISAPKQIGVGFATVSAGTTHAMAVKKDGSLWTWGSGTCGAFGPGNVLNNAGFVSDIKVPTQIDTGYKDAVAFARYSTIALKTDGSLWGWGQTGSGQLGDGITAFNCRATPQQIGTDFTAIAGGYSYAMALKSDGSVWSWGHLSISSGNTGADSAVPKQIGTGFVKIFMGTWRAYAISADGGLWAWGDSYDYGFANTFTYSAVPVRIN